MIVKQSELYKLYWVDNKNLKQIAELYGVSDVTVLRWMNKCGVARRERSAAARLRMSSLEVRRQLSMKLRKKFTPHPGPTLAYVLGVLLGDGSVHKNRTSRGSYSYRVSLYVKSKVFAEEFARALPKIGLNPTYFYALKNEYYRVEAVNGGFYEWYKSLALEQIRSMILGFEDEFIRGFYESEGSIGNDPSGSLRIQITNKRGELLFMIQNILNDWGIKSWVCGPYHTYFRLHIATNKRVQKFLQITKPCIKTEPKRRINDDLRQQKHSIGVQ